MDPLMALLGTALSCPEGISHAGKRDEPKLCWGKPFVFPGARGMESATAARECNQFSPGEGMALPGLRCGVDHRKETQAEL